MFRKIVVFILLLGVACGIVLYYLYEEKNTNQNGLERFGFYYYLYYAHLDRWDGFYAIAS